ncbi:hypothetical protein CXG81DRAFT_24846 [Caulochytrium protostelioides]|uniref:YjgF-like protein n=1 Tax=Caulochytrium protostelioides TaxID=1555241 RepID=A0A4P9XAR4_9FUNG|nr:hypothetical protein CXG81DRAFT_24846 [Caulochytrium protostelioides]|eukprot:RKP02473.1 hypothetical protein CXG81DRAFT_24846 [Caulochytrium protostelioides]
MTPNGKAIHLSDRAQGYANYPHARHVGNLIFVSGISSRRPDNTWEGVETGPDGHIVLDIAKQTHAVIKNIEAILERAGASLKNLVDVTVFLTDMAHYQAFNAVYNQYFNVESGPARTTIAVKQLPHPNLLIEIKSVAAL